MYIMVHHLLLSTVEVERLLAGEREGRRLYRWKKWKIFENNLEMKKVTRVFTTQASLGRGETGEGEEQESKSGKEPSRVAEDKESTREPGVRGVSCNCQL